MSRARELKPRSDATTRKKVADQVGSRFDSESEELFGKGKSRLQANLYSRLRRTGLTPERQSVSSTDTTLDVTARVMHSDEVAASPPPTVPYVSTGLAAQIHQSYLNNALNRMDIAGRTMSNEELKAEFKRFAEAALGRSVDMAGRSEVIESSEEDAEVDEDLENSKFVFDAEDPIRVRVAADRVYLTITAGLETPKETIDPQIITIPFDVNLSGNSVVMTRGTISVRPVNRPRNRVRQIAQANVMRNKIADTLPERRIDATFNIQLEERNIAMAVSTLGLSDGWVTITAN